MNYKDVYLLHKKAYGPLILPYTYTTVLLAIGAFKAKRNALAKQTTEKKHISSNQPQSAKVADLRRLWLNDSLNIIGRHAADKNSFYYGFQDALPLLAANSGKYAGKYYNKKAPLINKQIIKGIGRLVIVDGAGKIKDILKPKPPAPAPTPPSTNLRVPVETNTQSVIPNVRTEPNKHLK